MVKNMETLKCKNISILKIGLIFLLLFTLQTQASLIGDSVEISAVGVATQTATVSTGSIAEFELNFASDENISVNVNAFSIDFDFTDINHFWHWVPGLPGSTFDVIVSSLDLGAPISSITTSGSFFDGINLSATLLGADSFKISIPTAYEIIYALDSRFTVHLTASPVPEPSTFILLLFGIFAVIFWRSRQLS